MILKNRVRPKSVKDFSLILHGFLKFLFLRSSKKEKTFYNEPPFLGLHLVGSNRASASLIRISAASLIPDAYDNYEDKFSMAADFSILLNCQDNCRNGLTPCVYFNSTNSSSFGFVSFYAIEETKKTIRGAVVRLGR
jgi:hypothetical protein